MKIHILGVLIAISFANSSHFRGAFVSWIADNSAPFYFPLWPYSSSAKVNIRLGMSRRRSDSTGGYCSDQTIQNRKRITTYLWACKYKDNHNYYSSSYGSCTMNQLNQLSYYYCDNYNILDDYTVGYNNFTWTPFIGYSFHRHKHYILSSSTCCWDGGMVHGSSSSWHIQVEVDFQPRPDNKSRINSSPQVSYLPVYYIEAGRQQTFSLPVWDPDGDILRCRWANNFTEGGGVYQFRSANLTQNCSFIIPGGLAPGWYPAAIMVEDFIRNYTSGNYIKLSSIPLQFTFKVKNPQSYNYHGLFKNCYVCQQNCTYGGYYHDHKTAGYYTLYRCGCKNGYTINHDKKTCRVNGTLIPSPLPTTASLVHHLENQYVFDCSLCKQRCAYAGWSYYTGYIYACSCLSGYILEDNGRTCKVASSASVMQGISPTASGYPVLQTAIVQAGVSSLTHLGHSKKPEFKKQNLDRCRYYQILADHTRSVNYNDWSSYRCDKELYGWYRFMGQAGNRMANFCPVGVSGNFKCGSYYQGWLYGNQPSVNDGSVPRTVCFSSYYTCSCSYSTQVYVKNCGSFYVYWLNDVPACNLRYCGIKDPTTAVDCSDNSIQVSLDTRYFNYSLYSSITFKDKACKAYYSPWHNRIYLTTFLTSCGTTKIESSNHITYENEVQMIASAAYGKVITRNLNQNIRVSCTYSRNGQIVIKGFNPISTLNISEPGFGNFTFNFWMYTSKSYRSKNYIYPVAVQLRHWLYFETSVSSGDKDVFIIVDNCYTTPSLDSSDPMKYTFIKNRCPLDPTVEFLDNNSNNHRRRFSIQAFRFIGNMSAVYVHCGVFLCHRSSTDSRCHYGCHGNNIPRVKRKKRAINDRDIAVYELLNGPFIPETGSNKKGDQNPITDTPLAVIAMGIGVTVLAIVVVALAAKVAKMKALAKVHPISPYDDKYKQRVDRYTEMEIQDLEEVI